jgi:glycosyltransferase involved in cell wall biosynthesis
LNNETTLARPVRDLISVIVTTYNREDALGAVLRGLARQTDRKFEVIIADDGSPPSTACVIAAWQSQFDRLARAQGFSRGGNQEPSHPGIIGRGLHLP